MQGVRTNRGCINCRRKKKGCDFGLPTCARCIRFGLDCRYEERRWIFVNSVDDPSTATGLALLPATLSNSSQKSLCSTNTIHQLEEEFWSIYLPREDPSLDGCIGGCYSASWVPTIRALGEEDEDVHTALQACAFAGLGWMRSDPLLVRKAASLYARVLRETNAALRSEIRATSDAVLACCRLLSVYELFRRSTSSNAALFSSSPSSPHSSGAAASPASPNAADSGSNTQVGDWRSHIDGMCRLVELRGPQRHTSRRGRDLYDGVRMTAMIHSMGRRNPNAFTALPWTLPGLTIRDEFYELIAVAPELMVRMEKVNAQPASKSAAHASEVEELFERGYALSLALHAWEIRVRELCALARRGKAAAAGDFSNMRGHDEENSREIGEDLLASSCRSYGFGFFFICTQYWAACTAFYGAFHSFCLQNDGRSSSSPPPVWTDPEPYALNITSNAKYFFLPNAGLWAAQSAVFPISMALSYYARTGRAQSSQMKALFDAFANSKSGEIMRDFVRSIRREAESNHR